MHRRVHRSWLPLIVAALAVLVVLPTLAQNVEASTYRWTAKCDARIRTWHSTNAQVLRVIHAGATVRATAVVDGKRWSANCHGYVSGHRWLKIVAINGKSTKDLFGRSAVYAARGLFKNRVLIPPPPPPAPTPTPTPTTADLISNCSVRLRANASIDADTTAIIAENIVVTAADAAPGGSWAADCAGSVSGDEWYRIVEVGGQSVSSLYGVPEVYAASGLFRAAATSSYVEGIDVSKWQGVINWPMVAAAGKRFVIAKATEGVGYEDGKYDANKAGAIAAGLKLGAYHFARPDLNADGAAEADWFVDTAGYQPGMIIPTLDLERHGTLSDAQLINWVKAWLGRVYERLGVRPMIYASPNFWSTYMGNTRWFADNGYAILWVAHWGVTSPAVPGSNWGGRSWTFWQYTSSGSVPGISGDVDLNRYRFDSFDAVTYAGP
jgi:GH25 family lysozyme M1 (1,4-beta-N-acetylmuramidase)